MIYKGLRITEDTGTITVRGVKDFNPVHIFECGQCFRWKRQQDGSYTGIAKKKVCNVKLEGESLILSNSSIQDFIEIWFDYFDLGRDYSKIKANLRKDEIMAKAIDFGWGIRILRQDIWETLISFILSANNRIPMIMKTVEEISRAYGSEIYSGETIYYAFPDDENLAGTTIEQLEICKGGFRCKYISHTSILVNSLNADLKLLHGLNTAEARRYLQNLPGVGPKVADCVLLYSGTKQDVFPTDVWVKRVMEELYFKREASFREIQEFAAQYFGELAGFAQQYLFYYARENRIGVR